MKTLLGIVLVLLPLQAGAEVMHYNQCKLAAGKSLADLELWLKDWRALISRNDIDYRLRVLLPHADSDLGLDEFFLEGSTTSLASYAKGWEWWYSSSEAQALNTRLLAVASCKSGGVYLTSDAVGPR